MKIIKLTIRILLLNLVAVGLFAQDIPKAELFDELTGNATEEYVWAVMDSFYNKLYENPNAQGYIFFYGTAKQIARREKMIRDHIKNRRIDLSRFVFVNGGISESELTQIWMVPPGADASGIGQIESEKEPRPTGDACPIVSVTGPPAVVNPGETMTFTAVVEGVNSSGNSYNWSVDKGTIISGQGTSTITLSTEGLEGETITASVSVSGDFLEVCDSDASETGIVRTLPKAILIDQFQRANCEDVLMRTDNFFVHLQNNPGASGYIIFYGRRRAVAIAEREAKNWIRIRNFDPGQIVLVRGGGINERAEIEMWLVPPGADPPEVKPQAESEEIETHEKEPAIPTKPYIFSSEHGEGIAGCTEELDLEGYAAALKTNPKSRGNIVIYATSKEFFREREKEILDFLKDKGIARKRLRTFYQKSEALFGTELWFLP